MEDEDDVQGGELVPRDAQVQTDDDGVEDDAELEDEEGGDLLAEGLFAGEGVFGGGGVVFLEALFEGGEGGALGGLFVRGGAGGGLGIGVVVLAVGGDGAFDVLVPCHAVCGFHVALCAEVQQKDQHDCHQHDCRGPGVDRPVPRHAHAGRRTDLHVGRVEEVDKRCSDDDAGTEVASEQVDVERDAEAGDALGDDGEEGCGRRADEDDEEGGDACSQLAVVLVASGL